MFGHLAASSESRERSNTVGCSTAKPAPSG